MAWGCLGHVLSSHTLSGKAMMSGAAEGHQSVWAPCHWMGNRGHSIKILEVP